MKREIREQARAMRAQGKSVREITQLLSVSKSSVSMWVRDIQLSAEQVEHLAENQRRYRQQNRGASVNRERYRERRLVYQQEGLDRARQNRPLHQAGCLLYWAEGAKHKNKLYFVNSDPFMMRLFIRFLRDEMEISDNAISLYIHCHYAALVEQLRIEHYWLEVLSLSEVNLRKTQVKKGSDTRKNILINGVCAICVNNTRLVQHIYGAIQEYGGFENSAWLF